MLIKYGAKNFYCFKEGVEISFENPLKDKSTDEQEYSRAICVKGANSSGKTNVLKILSFLRFLCCDTFNLKPTDEISVDTYFDNNRPVELFIEFELSGIQFRYEASVTPQSFVFEKLYKKEKRLTLVIERRENKITKSTGIYKTVENVKLRSNASLISTANQYEVNEIIPIYNYLNLIYSNVHFFGLDDFMFDVSTVSKLYNDNQNLFNNAKMILKKFDLGIDDIEIHTRIDEKGNTLYYPIFYHKTKLGREFLTLHSQSSGTQTLYSKLTIYFLVLHQGGILVADEFDLHLHPHILPVLLNLFLNSNINKSNAQIVFTTHNGEIMDLLGKYRIVMVNKEDNESYIYRLDEVPGDIVRNDRSILPVYNSGKIGGVPKV